MNNNHSNFNHQIKRSVVFFLLHVRPAPCHSPVPSSSPVSGRFARCYPLCIEPPSGPGAHREEAAYRHHHHHYRAFYHPPPGGWDHATHSNHGHWRKPVTAEEQERHQSQQDRENGNGCSTETSVQSARAHTHNTHTLTVYWFPYYWRNRPHICRQTPIVLLRWMNVKGLIMVR